MLGWKLLGEIFPGEGRNEQTFSWCGRTFSFPPTRKNPVLYEYIYVHHVDIIVITIIIIFRVERIGNFGAQFFEHVVKTLGACLHHAEACISSAFIQKLVQKILYVKSAFVMYNTYQFIVVQGNLI